MLHCNFKNTYHLPELGLGIEKQLSHQGHGVVEGLSVLCREVILKVKVCDLWREDKLDYLVIQLVQGLDG